MTFLLYGANGYTGRLVAELAKARGLSPILAGRDRSSIEALAKELGLVGRVLSLEDPALIDGALKDVQAVLHCAGPFSATSKPMVDACLRTGRHYLDITGEIEIFEALAARREEAIRAGVMLLPGVGYDVVPSDCLAAHVKSRLPSATHLRLALLMNSKPSRGTATTAIEGLHRGGAVRRNGRIEVVASAHRTARFDFGDRQRLAVTIPWGDVSTAYYSTQIPNIEVYLTLPPSVIRMMQISRPFTRLLGARPIQKFLKSRVRAGPAGPNAAARESGSSQIIAEAEDGSTKVVSKLSGPEGYRLTADTALLAVARVLAGHHPPGFQTPSLAFGKDFVLEAQGVERIDLS